MTTNGVLAHTSTPPERPAGLTASQTVGPFFHYMLTPHAYAPREIFTRDLTAQGAAGERVVITGRVLDGEGAPVPDAMLEIWQADSEGRYAHPADTRGAGSNAFRGFGRSDTDNDGTFHFVTIKPGRVPGPNGQLQAPHIAINVFARGMPKQLVTRLYFAGDPANVADGILALVPPERRETLIAKREGDQYRFDVHLQGDGETVFFDL